MDKIILILGLILWLFGVDCSGALRPWLLGVGFICLIVGFIWAIYKYLD
jgi:hypothetical protein